MSGTSNIKRFPYTKDISHPERFITRFRTGESLYSHITDLLCSLSTHSLSATQYPFGLDRYYSEVKTYKIICVNKIRFFHDSLMNKKLEIKAFQFFIYIYIYILFFFLLNSGALEAQYYHTDLCIQDSMLCFKQFKLWAPFLISLLYKGKPHRVII